MKNMKENIMIAALFLSLILNFAIGFMYIDISEKSTVIANEYNRVNEAYNKLLNDVKTPDKNTNKKAYSLSNGNYTCGEDFQAGKYDIIVTKGTGNVICCESGINMIAGVKGSGDDVGLSDLYDSEFKNAEFANGDKLEVCGVTIRLVKK